MLATSGKLKKNVGVDSIDAQKIKLQKSGKVFNTLPENTCVDHKILMRNARLKVPLPRPVEGLFKPRQD